MNVPFFDPSFQNSSLEEVALDRVASVLRSNRFILGDEVSAFERAMAERFGVEEAVGVSSGTDALLLSLLALELGEGDEVITTPLTFVATSEAIVRAGLVPVFVDVDEFGNLDPDAVERAIGPATRAILPVHLFGRPASPGRLEKLAKERGLAFVEDAAQALGARAEGRNVGTFGEFAALSFFPTKPLGGFGDGGMVLTDARRAKVVRELRQHGSSDKRTFRRIGGNFRLDEIQAALLRIKLGTFDDLHRERVTLAANYERLLAEVSDSEVRSLGAPLEGPFRHAHHLFVVEVPDRDRVHADLRARGIATAVYYDVPLHRQPCFAGRARSVGALAVTEHLATRLLALPFFPGLSLPVQEFVAKNLLACVSGRGG